MNAIGKQLVAAVLIFGLISCSSPSIGAPPAPPAGPTTPPASRAATLYVATAQVPGSLASLPARASGSRTPLTHIEGPRTGLAYSFFDQVDGAAGRLWVTNCLNLPGTHGPVLAFRLGADGNAAPAVSIGGAETGLTGCQTGIALDEAGDVLVADATNTARFPGGHVAVFARGRRGNVVPLRQIGGVAAGFHSPAGMAIGANGEIYVADSCQGYPCRGDVRVFAPRSGGNAAPVRTIAGDATQLDAPQGIALDAAGDLYVADASTNTVTVYAAGASGDAAPIRVVRGANTRLDLPAGIAVDGAGFLYVGSGDGDEDPGTHVPVLVFAPRADGNARPRAAILLREKGLAVPSGVAVQ